MKLKFNWGTGIFIFVSIFMAFILTLVYKCSEQKVDLVSADYYDKEIQYQKQINRINNSSELATQIVISSENGSINVQFPEAFKNSKLIGNITFFKPDNAANDFEVPLKLNESLMQSISSKNLAPGRWNVKVTYNDENKEYYAEQKISLN